MHFWPLKKTAAHVDVWALLNQTSNEGGPQYEPDPSGRE
jgi:hypothetical protein